MEFARYSVRKVHVKFSHEHTGFKEMGSSYLGR